MSKKLIFFVVVCLAVVGAGILLLSIYKPSWSFLKNTKVNSVKTTIPSFDKSRYSIDDPKSPWVIVNKPRPLNPTTYAPGDLTTPVVPLRLAPSSDEMKVRKEAASALEKMVAAAKKEDANLMLASGYRSYQEQISVYNNEVKQFGKAVADSESARPGHSEHQTGWAADLEDAKRKCEVADCFGNLPEGKWLASNAYKYGFILRYQTGLESITGYRAEPWHIRYVGVELATQMHNQNVLTLEQFFNVVPEKQPY